MSLVITAPNPFPETGVKVYLGGAIDMGAAENWQLQVIQALKERDDLILLNPRRADFKPEDEVKQIHWELAAMEAANYIIMWFPKSAEAPVSFLETGLYLSSGKLLLGVENGFYRQKNIELTAKRYNVAVHHKLGEIIHAILTTYADSKK